MAENTAIIVNGKGLTYRAIAIFQYRENYGAHAWDGNGECPQHWKNKGGHEILLADGLTSEMIHDSALRNFLNVEGKKHEEFNDWTQYHFMGIQYEVTGTATYRDIVNAYCDFFIDMDENWQDKHDIIDLKEVSPDMYEATDRFDAEAEKLGYLNA